MNTRMALGARWLAAVLLAAAVTTGPAAWAASPMYFTDVDQWASLYPMPWYAGDNGKCDAASLKPAMTYYPYQNVKIDPVSCATLVAGDPAPNPGGPFGWAANEITDITRWDIMMGYDPDGLVPIQMTDGQGNPFTAYAHPEPSFKPGGTLTRAEFAAILARAAGLPDDPATPFADVPGDSWFAPYVGALVDAGILKAQDYPDGLNPGGAITREEIAWWVGRAAAHDGIQPSASPVVFPDLPQGDPHYADVETAVRLGIVKGEPDGTFRPQATATRAEAAVMIDRFVRQDKPADPQATLAAIRDTVVGLENLLINAPTGTPQPYIPGIEQYMVFRETWLYAPWVGADKGVISTDGTGGLVGATVPGLLTGYQQTWINGGPYTQGITKREGRVDAVVPKFLGRTVAEIYVKVSGTLYVQGGLTFPVNGTGVIDLRLDGGRWKVTDTYNTAHQL